MIKSVRIPGFVFLPFLLAMSLWASAGDVQRVGGA